MLERPKEYTVRFRFPETSNLQPPILGLYNADFNYENQPPLFKKVEFGEILLFCQAGVVLLFTFYFVF